jgi:DNA polymerase-1
LEQLGDVIPQFATYTELRHIEKMIENYVAPYGNETVHPSFVPLVSTGRTGCRTPNTQNVPRKDKDRPDEAFRTMFMARKGRVLGTVDYSQLELCTLAATIRMMFPNVVCTLGNAIDEGKDVHCITGGLIGGMSYEQMIAGKKSKDENVLRFRQGAKAANFGLPGGLGGGAFVGYAKNNYNVQLSLNQAWKYINSWKRAWPEVPNHYLRRSADMVDSSPTGTFTSYTITGRPKANCIYTEGSNYPFQGLAADGAKAALWAIWRECILGWYWNNHAGSGYGHALKDSPLRDSRLVNFVHDEIVAEHLEGDAGKAALKRQEALMISEMTRICQNKIKISVEGQISDAWEH